MDNDEILIAENDRLKKLTEAKSNLISVTIHQLRTRLTAFKWLLKLLLDKDTGPLTSEQERLIREATADTEKSLAIASDVLTVNKLENNTPIYEHANVNMREIIAQIMETFQAESVEKKLNVTLDCSEDCSVSGDAKKLSTAFENLIENALKYTPAGGDVRVSCKCKEGLVSITIADSGIGIPSTEQAHIFEKFYRATNGVAKEHVGSGLGLYAAQEIIKNHGGHIWFESKEGVGTTFFISLPAQMSY